MFSIENLRTHLRKFLLANSRVLGKCDNVFFIVAVIGDFIFSIYKILPHIWINPYLLRDLSRASLIGNGYFPVAGPDTLSGGHLPGGFFYLLSYPIVAIFGENPLAFAAYTLCLKSFSFGVMAWLLGRELNYSKSICFLIFA